jgi:hypothetical protein
VSALTADLRDIYLTYSLVLWSIKTDGAKRHSPFNAKKVEVNNQSKSRSVRSTQLVGKVAKKFILRRRKTTPAGFEPALPKEMPKQLRIYGSRARIVLVIV